MTTQAVRDAHAEHELTRYRVVGVPQPELDDLAAVAATLCQVPVATINLTHPDGPVTIAAYGVDPATCSLPEAGCDALRTAQSPIEVADASLDARWADHRFVNGELGRVRFFAAVPLVSPCGIAVGTLCLFDVRPRVSTPEQWVRLERVAGRVVDLLELRLRTVELEQTVADLTAARVELQRSNEMLDLFAGQVAHDLRGPLTGLTMTLGTLREEAGPDQDSDQAWVLDRALLSAARMNTLIGDMLDFASLGASPQVGEMDLAEVMRLVRDDLAAGLTGVRLVAEDLPVVPGGATQWRVVLQNLVANAVKFTAHVEEPLIRVSAGTDGGGWWLEVADNGPGVPSGDRERVFELLAQADPSRGGIGLGLATCRRIVQAYAGSIVIQDAPEGGALVRLQVPAP